MAPTPDDRPADPDDPDEEGCYPGPCPSDELVERACRNVNRLEQSKLDVDRYFETHIYQPAMRDKKVSRANRRFLGQLRAYRKKRHTRERAMDESDTGWVPPVASSFVMGVYTEHEDFDLANLGMVVEPETTFNRAKYASVHVIGIDSVVRGTKVKPSRPYRAACAEYPTYPLASSRVEHMNKPLLATRTAIDLEFRSDKRMDEMLADANWCRNVRSYCDPISKHVSFAALKGVPGLYLTYSEGWFPARGIAMNINDEFAVLMWEFSFELIECSCI